MNVTDLALVAEACRSAQREYFRTRSVSALQDSIRLEKKLDRCVTMVLQGQKQLFEGSPQASGTHDAL